MATNPADFFAIPRGPVPVWVEPEVAVFGTPQQVEPTPFDAPSSDEMYEMLERSGMDVLDVGGE